MVVGGMEMKSKVIYSCNKEIREHEEGIHQGLCWRSSDHSGGGGGGFLGPAAATARKRERER